MQESLPLLNQRRAVRTCLSMAAAVASLVACGGGDTDTADGVSLTRLDQQALALASTLHDYCNVGQPLVAASGNVSGYDYSPWKYWNNNRLTERTGSVYAWGRAEVSSIGWLRLETDYRDYSTALGQALVSAGVANDIGMGVVLFDMLPDQAVGCVHSVAHPVFAAQAEYNGVLAAVEWSGRSTAPLPATGVGGAMRNGFEFAANFSVPASRGFVYFNVPQTDVSAPDQLHLCHLPTGEARWRCQRPDITPQGTSWSVRVPGAQPGVYALI